MTDTLMLPAAAQLLDCLCTALNANDNPPQICCLRAGQVVTQDAGIMLDECCVGQAYVRIDNIYPVQDFPNPLTDFVIPPCGLTAWGLVLEMGVFRCAPKGSANFPPTCDAWTAAAVQQADDMKAMRCAANCFKALFPPSSMTFGSIDAQGPEGGCLGATMVIQVEILNCAEC